VSTRKVIQRRMGNEMGVV